MHKRLEAHIKEALQELGNPDVVFAVEHPAEFAHGDYATNVAMVAAKKMESPPAGGPRAFAEEIVAKLKAKNDPDIAAIEVAGPGFINFRIADSYFTKELARALKAGEHWGWNETLKGKKAIVEHTDPNPFKEFHVGHLMSNTVGEALSRIVEASGALVRRACYQGDKGLHVAMAIWGMMKLGTPVVGMGELGKAYAMGAKAHKEDEAAKKEIETINKMIYGGGDPALNALYKKGRELSLAYFEEIYKKLGTKFDHYFFESETGEAGKKIVQENVGGVFKESEGAVVYKGDEAKGLHTRVFLNKDGLPTYEAKELGLAKAKYDIFPYDVSIVVTGNEINDYFKVLLDAMGKIFPDLAAKTEHISHGMLRLPSGKMSSRTGDVITAESLLADVRARVMEKIVNDVISGEEKAEIAEMVSVAAIKYSILRQASGRDIIFDFEQSLSFEGDSGPYLQYTHARTASVLAKAGGASIDPSVAHSKEGVLAKLLARFPSVVERAGKERESHYITTYLVELAREFNSFYGNTLILDGSPEQPYKLALTKALGQTIKNGLWMLGISAPNKM